MATMKLRIPEDEYPVLSRMMRLSEQEAKDFAEALDAVPPTLLPSRFASNVRAHSGIDQAFGMVIALINMSRSVDHLGITESEMVESVVDTVKAEEREDVQPPDGNWDVLKERLQTFLSFEHSVGFVAKASELSQENQRTFHEAQILTDVRPVFRKDPVQTPMGVIVTHQLRIGFHEDDRVVNFFVSLGAEDLQEIREVIDRAEVKAKTVTRTLAVLPMPTIGEQD